MESQRFGMHISTFREQEQAAQEQPTQEQQLAAIVVEEEELGSDGEECEIHVYENKYDTRGEKVTLRAVVGELFAGQNWKSNRVTS
ncbi:MAG: hypothetical protein Q9198_006099 [Flavoplaca austrocitrina]